MSAYKTNVYHNVFGEYGYSIEDIINKIYCTCVCNNLKVADNLQVQD